MSAAVEEESLTQIRAAELRRIAAEHGGVLKPEDVVEEAKDPDNPLHSAFEWSNTEAARKYRLWQARQLISITVRYSEVKGEARDVRVFVSLKSDRKEEGGYRETVAVLTNPNYRAQLLADAREDLRRMELKYGELVELAAVFKASRKFREALD